MLVIKIKYMRKYWDCPVLHKNRQGGWGNQLDKEKTYVTAIRANIIPISIYETRGAGESRSIAR